MNRDWAPSPGLRPPSPIRWERDGVRAGSWGARRDAIHRAGAISKPGNRAAFTLIELLVVIAIIGILASLLMPALAKAKQKGQGIVCMNNQKQLTLAWLTYAHDNDDRVAAAMDDISRPNGPPSWVTGGMNFEPGNRSNWDVAEDIAKSPLGFFSGASALIFKCPADRSTVIPSSGPYSGKPTPRVRSMVMNIWFAGWRGTLDPNDVAEDGSRLVDDWPMGLRSTTWQMYRQLTEVNDPGPAWTFLFLDQRADTAIPPAFFIDMQGWPAAPRETRWHWGLPAASHNEAGVVSFVDGHTERKRWLDSRTTPPLQKGRLIEQFAPRTGQVNTVASPDNRDIVWLQERATRRIR
ncbi:MAG: type II secretion system protein [Limisphaerales bacterium]